MKFFSKKDNTITHFSEDMKPNGTVQLNETIVVETYDCYGGQIDSEEVMRPDIDLSIMNQATGPFFVNDLTKNDVLKIDIINIELDSTGIMMTSPGLGVLGEKITKPMTRLLAVKGHRVYFSDDLSIPVRPMIGVIGVAPKEGSFHCAVPGNHGGNLDTKDITAGNSIYLPVFQEGGLFALGDLHASMGDGELNGTGVEINGESTLFITKLAHRRISAPIVETAKAFMFLESANTLEGAIELCAERVTEHLTGQLAINFDTAYRLLSAACDIQISQVVNKLVTVRIAVPKTLLPALFMK